jgi:CDP-diacylglycerol--serine O-phosphatidyltransferase
LASKDKQPLRAVDQDGQGSDQNGAQNAEPADTSLRRKGIFLLPNVITTGALFAGFYAIIAAMNGDFLPAVLAVFIAMFLDTADGRVARITMSESAFGAQYDSLSDMVAFGVAPAVVAFSWGLSSLGQFGWVATFVYMACAALRLARFNTESDSASFTGLASPSAAGLGHIQYLGCIVQWRCSAIVSARKHYGCGYRVCRFAHGLKFHLLLT